MIVRPLVIGTIMENTYILGSEESGDCVIIDPGGEADRVLEEVETLGLKIGMIHIRWRIAQSSIWQCKV